MKTKKLQIILLAFSFIISSCNIVDDSESKPFTCNDPLSYGVKYIPSTCSCGDSETGYYNCPCNEPVCGYSSFVFYASDLYKPYTSIKWKSIKITVKDLNSTNGEIKAAYSNYVPECNESFNYELTDSNPLQWEALILWSNNTYEIRRGTLSPSPESTCIPVKIL